MGFLVNTQIQIEWNERMAKSREGAAQTAKGNMLDFNAIQKRMEDSPKGANSDGWIFYNELAYHKWIQNQWSKRAEESREGDAKRPKTS